MEFTKNHNKLGMIPQKPDQAWYTKEVARIGTIHVHNITEDGRWTYIVYILKGSITKAGFETAERAATEATTLLRRMVQAAMFELQTDVKIE